MNHSHHDTKAHTAIVQGVATYSDGLYTIKYESGVTYVLDVMVVQGGQMLPLIIIYIYMHSVCCTGAVTETE